MIGNKQLEFNSIWIPQRADPYVYRHRDGMYYFTASVPEYDRIVLRRAESLEALPDVEEHIIWVKHEEGPMSIHIWAPELHYLNGKWYVYYAGGDKDDEWEIRPYVLECTDEDPITGRWSEKGMMQRADTDSFSFKDFSLDGTVFENKGKYYYVWSEKVNTGKKIANLYIAEMESPCKLKTAQVLLSTPDYDWERVGFWVNEGPFVIKNGEGQIFLTYSASETGVCYCIGMLTADTDSDLMDPLSWRKSRYPVLETDGEKGIYGPGHNCFTKLPDGTDIMVYHARLESEITGNPLYNPNRHAMLMKIGWERRDGVKAPVFKYE